MTATAPTLTEFLLARIAEDGATDAGLPHRDSCRQFGGWPGDPGSAVECSCGVSDRVLAVCEAHRRIVEELSAFLSNADEMGADQEAPTLLAGIRRQLLHLAAIYANRDGFQEEWRCASTRTTPGGA